MNIVTITLLFFTITIPSTFSQPHNYTNFITPFETPQQQYYELTQQLPPNNIAPSCSINVLNHTFENTTNYVTVDYTPPSTTCEWSHAVLEFHAECIGQPIGHNIAGVWIEGVELLRTSMANPSDNETIFWNVRKDVTRYFSIITQNNLTLSVMLENLINEGVNYSVNVSFIFYSKFETSNLNRKLISYKDDRVNYDKLGLIREHQPADLIIPISTTIDEGCWFRIQDEFDVKMANVEISKRTYKAVLELYVSFHGDDEFWYMNPPDSYLKAYDLSNKKIKGPYREVLVTIDDKLVGIVTPYPVIYTNGINPLLWRPFVAIGAFDLPSYDIEFTPYLGFLLDNKKHSISFQVTNGVSYWLVSANLHMWLDHSNVQAFVEYTTPSMEIEDDYDFDGLDGEFEIEIERRTSTIGWIHSSLGILRTKVTEEMHFRNKLKFSEKGSRKQLEQKIKTKTRVKMTNEKDHLVRKTITEKLYPLNIDIVTGAEIGIGTPMMNTTVVQGRRESFSDEKASIKRVMNRNLNCSGSMLVNGDSIVSGSMENHQNYKYKDDINGHGCYSRKVDVVESVVVVDEASLICVH
ncbi:peptide-N4-(N-acetyl-beta-glucosaminyl)asparagine amidase A-like [Rutidosis leptorrhynchoides]|uniref:peptide-N4-(N-acetyl-beta- glucosaminyl)asparagine amidase A-like n=1 Tax=Rutidosis leptorrhynchoides TaxID=125765 RepID=UPI003A9A5558